jgi:hypothetical protein
LPAEKKNSTIKRRIEKKSCLHDNQNTKGHDHFGFPVQCGSVVSSAMHIAQFNQLGVLKVNVWLQQFF